MLVDENPDSPSQSHTELTDNECMDFQNLEERQKILVDAAKLFYTTPLSSIDSINLKIISLLQILVGLGAIGAAIVTFLYQFGHPFSMIQIIIICCTCVLGFCSFAILSWLLSLRSYTDIRFFDEDRFNRLCNSDAGKILSDLLFQMRKSYLSNYEKSQRLAKWFRIAYALFFLMILFSIGFIAVVLLYSVPIIG